MAIDEKLDEFRQTYMSDNPQLYWDIKLKIDEETLMLLDKLVLECSPEEDFLPHSEETPSLDTITINSLM